MPLDTLVQVLEGEPIPPRQLNPAIPRPLEAICLRCLEKAPQRRYATAGAVAENLERFLRDEPVEGLAPGLLAPVGRWARRQPALASRLAALTLCFALIQANFLFASGVRMGVHLIVTGLLLGWGAASFVFQKLLNTGRWDKVVPSAWAAADMLLWTALLVVDGGAPESPVVIGYACLIAAAGLWFRVQLVWFVTILSLLSYGIVLAVFCAEGGVINSPHMQFIFAIALVVLGGVVAYQVNRVRALSRYYERRPLP
jgi:serine/threonine-protein kinase